MIRRTIPICVVLALLGALAIAGPALSLRPYSPDPVDFELAAPGGEAKAGQVVTLRAPKRFNLVGARWRGAVEPKLWMRVRKDDRAWGRWTPVGAHADHAPDPGTGEGDGQGVSDPVWVGEGDDVQLRSSRRLPGLRMHFVNTTGTATRADRARTALRRAVNGAVLAAARTFDADARAADQPPIVPRSGWGAQNCQPRSAPSYGEVKAAFVHHTVSMNNYSREEAPAMVLAICRYHRDSNGWDDIGYTFVVDKYGTIYEGRAGGVDRAPVGAHTQGFNDQSTGIANLGTFTSVPQSGEAMDAMARLIRWKLELHGQPTSGPVTLRSNGGGSNRWAAGTQVTLDRISGHRDGNATACPGDSLYAQLPDLRARVGGGPPTATQPTRTATRLEISASKLVRFPGSARVKGRLRLSTGAAVGGAPVDVEQLSGSTWRAVGRARTGSSGRFTTSVKLSGRRTIRLRFAGDEGRAPTSSGGKVVTVVPSLTLSRTPAKGAKGQPVTFSGEIGPYRSRLTLIIARRVKGTYRRVASLRLTVRRAERASEEGEVTSYGTFLRTYTPPKTGMYRAYVVFPGDRRFGPTASRTLHAQVTAPQQRR